MTTQAAQGAHFDERETPDGSSAGTPTNGHAPDFLALSEEAVQALPAAIYTTDAEGRITFYNEAAAALWGCRPELGKSEFCGSWKLYWPDGTPLPHDECPMAMALQQRRPIRGMEALAERPDGTRIPFVPYPTPLFDASGRLTGAVNMLVDISERKRTEAALKNRDAQFELVSRIALIGSYSYDYHKNSAPIAGVRGYLWFARGYTRDHAERLAVAGASRRSVAHRRHLSSSASATPIRACSGISHSSI